MSIMPPVANGHVYLNGDAVSGTTVEAININGTDHVSTISGDNGAFTLNIMPATPYKITATCQKLQHTIWPVYLDNKSDTFNINLTTMPASTIEGTGYVSCADPENRNLSPDNFKIILYSTKDHTIISRPYNKDGSYSVDVESNVTYEIDGTLYSTGMPAITGFFYHNYPYGYQPLGNKPKITVGPNETVLIDYIVVVP